MAAPRNMTDAEADAYFFAHARLLPNGCRKWLGARRGPGYGHFRGEYVHRWAYRRFVGPIPDGLDIDHICHNKDETCLGGRWCQHRGCVEPSHLEAVPRKTNAHRGRNGPRKFCSRGHELSEENSYYRRDGKGRMCRKCSALRARSYPPSPYNPEARRRTYLRKKERDGRTDGRTLPVVGDGR